MRFLKQSTAVNVMIGPFIDDTDFKTAETALTVSQADVQLSKNAAAFAQKNDATSCTHRSHGHYMCPLDATDTNTLGRLRLSVSESGALLVWEDFMVIPAEPYDTIFAGTDNLTVDISAAAEIAIGAIVPSDIEVGDAVIVAAQASPIFANVQLIADDGDAPTNLALGYNGNGYLEGLALTADAVKTAVTAHSGVATGGSSTTITLAASASDSDDEYNGQIILLVSGTGSVQAAVITDYDGTTKVATVAAWPLGTNPASGTVYHIVIG